MLNRIRKIYKIKKKFKLTLLVAYLHNYADNDRAHLIDDAKITRGR
jgi:hypothetical protein